ncbi:hypothetical protein F3J44_22020 [Pantoea sp. Tr-811]|uniref:hypothetical protein n=1 Tax=Pantoea sp. Tr-811 TaxID=2608361 RepID=UPI00141D82A8|nr:hypothetical protein [Pantoea sp. Tr-811]NIF29048.1 hypothetical protein [Pantoea sp. Tr-811]
MSITWLFSHHGSTKSTPYIKDQVVDISTNHLTLRNPWIKDSVFMGKLYTAIVLISALYIYPEILDDDYRHLLLSRPHSMLQYLIAPLIFIPFLLYRAYIIKNNSHFHLSRLKKRVYYQRGKKLVQFDWKTTMGGAFKRTEFGGSSFSTSYALAFAPRRADGTLHQKDCLWIDSNEPTEPDVKYVAEVWEYLRHFMDHGPDKLPPPGEPNWWHVPLHAICLTPAQAWRHYAPWRTGEPGELQGKKNWQLPLWAVLFPYNLSVAICWYFICILFNVKAAPAPPEALESSPRTPEKRKRR